MVRLICERLVFLTPSIDALIRSPSVQQFCISSICATRSYLKCCYISLHNFLFEILEVTNIDEASEFAFFKEAQNLSCTKWIATGLRIEGRACITYAGTGTRRSN